MQFVHISLEVVPAASSTSAFCFKSAEAAFFGLLCGVFFPVYF